MDIMFFNIPWHILSSCKVTFPNTPSIYCCCQIRTKRGLTCHKVCELNCSLGWRQSSVWRCQLIFKLPTAPQEWLAHSQLQNISQTTVSSSPRFELLHHLFQWRMPMRFWKPPLMSGNHCCWGRQSLKIIGGQTPSSIETVQFNVSPKLGLRLN